MGLIAGLAAVDGIEEEEAFNDLSRQITETVSNKINDPETTFFRQRQPIVEAACIYF